MFDWLRTKKTFKQRRDESEHPFDRAAREVNDALARYHETTETLEEKEERRVARAAMARTNA